MKRFIVPSLAGLFASTLLIAGDVAAQATKPAKPAAKGTDDRPYKRKDELVKRETVPQATYDRIKDQVIAKQTAAANDAKSADKKKN